MLSVAAGLAAGQSSDRPRIAGVWLSSGFALGIATTDALIGALFGVAGFAVMRVLGSFLALVYAFLATVLIVTALALLRLIHVAIPMFAPSIKPARSFLGSYFLGLPFGLSTCPACTPLVLPVVLAAATTADPASCGVETNYIRVLVPPDEDRAWLVCDRRNPTRTRRRSLRAGPSGDRLA